VDGLIAPAFPSNTARSGVIYPLAFSLAGAAGVNPDENRYPRLGSFLMFSGIVSLSLSSALWLTAMAANPIGTEIARNFGVQISFASWLIAASVPTLAGIALMPPLLFWLIGPEVRSTPQAPAEARKALAKLGPLGREEKIVLGTFVGMVALWGSAATIGIDSTAVAFLGLGVLLVSGALTLDDIAKQGDVLATFIWFAVLFTLSSQLNELGFMGFLGERLAAAMVGWAPIAAGLVLIGAYVLLHYARRSGGAARVSTAVCYELLLCDHASGFEREPAVRGKRISLTGGFVSARWTRDSIQPGDLSPDRHALADAGRRHTIARVDLCERIRSLRCRS
jgi:DASS family divalent anion:Na+ symporter